MRARDRREVEDHHHEIVRIARVADDRDDAVLVVVAVDPAEARGVEVHLVKRRLGAVVPVEILNVSPQTGVRRLVEQVPVETVIVVPFAPLPELRPHEEQLLAGMPVLVAVQRAQRRELLPHVARQLVEHRAFSMDDFVVGEREDEIFGVHVERRKRHLVVIPAAVHRILVGVHQHVVHPPHVPFVGESETAEMDRTAHARKGGRFLGRGDAARMLAVRQLVQLLKKVDRVEVLPAAERVRHPLALGTRVVEIQHRRHRVHTQAVDVVLLEPEQGVRQQEVADLVASVVENQRAPVLMFTLPRVGMLVQRRAVELRKARLSGNDQAPSRGSRLCRPDGRRRRNT